MLNLRQLRLTTAAGLGFGRREGGGVGELRLGNRDIGSHSASGDGVSSSKLEAVSGDQ